jgi:hypothetical protein
LLPKRLAYPEHLPEHRHGEFFYTDFEDLTRRLAELCRNVETVRRTELRKLVVHYDWATLAPTYDALFTRLAAGALTADHAFAVDRKPGVG